MAGVAVDGSPWVTGLQAGGVVFATLGCTIFGAALAARSIRRAVEAEPLLPPQQQQGRLRFRPEEYAALQQRDAAEWKEEVEPLYEQDADEQRQEK